MEKPACERKTLMEEMKDPQEVEKQEVCFLVASSGY